LSKYCPEWIFSSCSAETARVYLSSNNSIISVAKKFATVLSEKYNEIRFEEIVDVAEQILHFLSEIKAGEEAVKYLNDYIHYRVNYEATGSERKLSGIFSSAFDGDKIKDYSSPISLKIFRATTYSIRSNTIPAAVPGWLITDKEDIDWLGEVFEQEVDAFKI
jgi:hypothetical protein